MPKLRVRIPVAVEITDDEAAALAAAGDVVKRARETGLPEALGRFADAFRRVKRRRRR